jgi:hypothetical protein
MQTIDNLRGNFFGRSLVQQRGTTGGARNVFVKLQGIKNELVFPTFGGRIMNPFKGAAKMYAGDLCEYRTNDEGLSPQIYLFKTYKVKNMSGTTVHIYRDGYKHIPFVGDVLMKAPDTLGTTTNKAYTVTAVVKSTYGGADTWQLTLNTAIDSCEDGDVLIEAKEENGSAAETMVKNLNAVLPCDYDFLYMPSDPSDEEDEYDLARYMITPALGGLMYKSKMSPMPACADKFNTANVNGWFKIGM